MIRPARPLGGVWPIPMPHVCYTNSLLPYYGLYSVQNGSAFRLTDSHEHAIHNTAQAIQQLVAVVARGGTETSLDDVINVQQYKATDVVSVCEHQRPTSCHERI